MAVDITHLAKYKHPVTFRLDALGRLRAEAGGEDVPIDVDTMHEKMGLAPSMATRSMLVDAAYMQRGLDWLWSQENARRWFSSVLGCAVTRQMLDHTFDLGHGLPSRFCLNELCRQAGLDYPTSLREFGVGHDIKLSLGDVVAASDGQCGSIVIGSP